MTSIEWKYFYQILLLFGNHRLWLQQPSEKQKRYEYKFPCFPER